MTPLIHSRAVDPPPGLLVVTQLSTGPLFGRPGVALAALLPIVALVAVRCSYVEGSLEPGRGSGAGPTDPAPGAAPTRRQPP